MAEKKSELAALMADMKEMLGESVTEDELKVLAIAIMLPTVNARVDRKINMGNYESLGIGVSVNQPLLIPEALKPTFTAMESDALRLAYNQAATEINKRVDRIKARAKGEDVE
jgi:hypothetical protein